MNRILHAFMPDHLEPSRAPLARLTVSVLLASLLASIVIVILTLFNGDIASNRAFLLLIVTILVSLWLFKNDQMEEASYLFSILLWLVVSFVVMFVGDGTKGVQILGFPLLILLSALILGQNGAILAAVLSSISFIGISLAQKYQWPWPYPLADRIVLMDAVGAVIVFAIVALIQRTLFGHLSDGLEKVRVQEQNLQNSLREVQDSQAALEAAYEHRTGQILAATQVGRAASALLDPDEILQQSVQLISESFGYYYSAVYLVDENRIWAEIRAATGEGGQALLARKHRLQIGGSSILGAAIVTGKPRLALDVGPDPVRFEEPLLPETRSQIVLPLAAGGQVLGALDLQSVIEAAFSDEDIQTLQEMADQVAVAFSNARQHQETQTRLKELTGLYGRQELKTLHSIQLRGSELATNQPVTLPDLARVLKEKRLAVHHQGDRTVATIPMLSGGQVVGVLNMKSKNRRWTQEEISIIESIAAQSAVALENARLERENQIRAERERVFSESTARIRETLDFETILKTAADEMRRALSLAQVEVHFGEQEPDNGSPEAPPT